MGAGAVAGCVCGVSDPNSICRKRPYMTKSGQTELKGTHRCKTSDRSSQG